MAVVTYLLAVASICLLEVNVGVSERLCGPKLTKKYTEVCNGCMTSPEPGYVPQKKRNVNPCKCISFSI